MIRRDAMKSMLAGLIGEGAAAVAETAAVSPPPPPEKAKTTVVPPCDCDRVLVIEYRLDLPDGGYQAGVTPPLTTSAPWCILTI